jgi:phosphatidylinositol alpha-mannosyltransferase
VSLLACWLADGAIVATMHTSNPRSRTLSLLVPAVQPAYEKIRGRIAVSEPARRTMVEHLGGDAVLIPNGVAVDRYAGAQPLEGWPGPGGALGFLGRMDEPRKGLIVLLRAFARLAAERPGLRLLLAGPGDGDEIDEVLPADLRDRVHVLGQVDEAEKARMMASIDVFVAPNLGKESFGIVLLEAMATGTSVLASDIEAFRRVLDDGRAGALFPVGDATALAEAAGALLDDPARRKQLVADAQAVVRRYDWKAVAQQIVQVYETVTLDRPGVHEAPVVVDDLLTETAFDA